VERFLDSLLPSEAELLAQKGDEVSLRAALQLDSGHADASVQLASMLHGRRQDHEALEILGKVHRSFAADGLAARIRLEQSGVPDLRQAFAALDAGDREKALEVFIEAISRAGSSRDEIRRVVVGILDELGLDHPLAASSRSRLASAFY
jgi:putative thioredoxin